MPYIYIFLASLGMLFIDKAFRRNNTACPELKESLHIAQLFHANYTAGLIEDEIRKIREEDYKWREKYNELYGEKKI